MASPTSSDPRALALRLIHGVVEGGQMLSTLMADEAVAQAPGPVQATAQRLTLSVLRQVTRADAVLKPHLGRPISAEVRAILRLAVTELLADGGAEHGVVHAAVGLAKSSGKTSRASGLVNAVLHRVIEAGPEKWEAAQDPRLPNWLRGRLSSAHGNRIVAAIEAAHAKGAPLDITPKSDPEVWAEKLGGDLLPTGSVRLAKMGQVSGLPGFEEGAWWVQDTAATLAARALAVSPGERVLDLCAAPGGKTLQLAAQGAQVTALDVSEHRLERVTENLTRLGLSADVVAADALEWAADPFDAVLLDAPCSATGTIRRHPDLPYVRDPSALKEVITLQNALLRRAALLTKPGGRLVYCTCSLLREEGEVIQETAEEAGLKADPAALDALAPMLPEDAVTKTGLRTRPDMWADRGGMDGFYVAAFTKSV